MKNTFKTLTIAAACTLPIAQTHAWPVMTPEELKAALEAIRQESITRSDFPFKIEAIEYASDGVPTSIKGINITPEYINAKLMERIEPFSLNIKDKADLEKACDRLGALSKKLSADTLKERGVDTDRLEKLGIKEVREITFRSILDSRFFTDAQRKKPMYGSITKGNSRKRSRIMQTTIRTIYSSTDANSTTKRPPAINNQPLHRPIKPKTVIFGALISYQEQKEWYSRGEKDCGKRSKVL